MWLSHDVTRTLYYDVRCFPYVTRLDFLLTNTIFQALLVYENRGYPRVLGTPVPKSLVFWVSPVGIPKTLKALDARLGQVKSSIMLLKNHLSSYEALSRHVTSGDNHIMKKPHQANTLTQPRSQGPLQRG